MHCLANICYVCLEKKSKLIKDINNSLLVNKDIIDILGYLPCNLAWLKTLRIILICEECCLRLRENYQFLEKCLKNSALLRSYMDLVNISSRSYTDNEAELLVHLNIKNKNINEAKVEIKLEEEIYPFKWEENIVETEDVFVKLEADNAWKREVVDDNADYSMGNNSTENSDKESDSTLSINGNAQITNTDCASTEFASKQVHATNKDEVNTAAKNVHKCPTCNKSFITKNKLKGHTLIHTSEKPYTCSSCKKCFTKKSKLICHMQIHTGEKPYECTVCKKCFNRQSNLTIHMRMHTGEKPYECATCKKCFKYQSNLAPHMLIHTGEKPHECTTCKKCFVNRWDLTRHIRIHTNKPYECVTCKKCFKQQSRLASHMQLHTGEKPHKCATCKSCFVKRSDLTRHIRIHTGEKPYECKICKKCFNQQSNLMTHMEIHTGEKSFNKCT